jgi:HEAT repeat protein
LDVEKLVADLVCDDVIRCQNARRGLVALGESAIGPLTEALHHKNHWVHWEAAKALGQIGSPLAIDALIDALQHDEFEHRWVAAEALIRIGRPVVRPLLRELTKKPGSTWLQQGAHHVLSDMKRGSLNSVLKPVVQAVAGSSPSTEIPIAAKRALDSLNERGE